MKKNILFFSVILALTACNKVTINTPDDFDVTTDKTTYTVRDTIKFNISGNPDYISFYSGEVHHKYAYINTSYMLADSNILSFSTATTAASTTTQPLTANNVSLLYSKNFSGIMDSANIRKAIWTDISNQAVFATTTTTVASGNIHLESLSKDTTPVYLAFKYISDTAKATYLSRKWVLSTFSLKNYFSDTTFALGNSYTTGGFYAVSLANNLNSWVYGNTSSITQTFTFNAPAVGSLPDEDWVVSRPFNLSQFPPDLGVYVKNMGDNPVTMYKKVQPYAKPGTYIATFVAKNQDLNNSAQVVKQITLTITP